MKIPTPYPGMVISYGYLWHAEHAQGRDEGVKDRPCAIVLSVRKGDGDVVVTVVPVTHRRPKSGADSVEIPAITKKRLGLDRERSWVIVNEVNRFVWPGPDLRRVPGRSEVRCHYGPLPPRLFDQIKNKLLDAAARQRLEIVRRKN
jgi:hypothetical protein